MKTRLLLTLGAMALIGCDHHAAETPTTVDAPEARVVKMTAADGSYIQAYFRTK